MDRRDTHQLSPTLKVELFERIVSGHGRIGIRFEHQLADGSKQEFRTDLARLEYVADRAEEYRGTKVREEQLEKVGDTDIRFKAWTSARHGETTLVSLSQMARDGSEEVQQLTAYSHHIRDALKQAAQFEKELGYGNRWHSVVDATSFKQSPNGRIFADVVKSFESEEKAREFLGKNQGLALALEPQRREFKKGEMVELWEKAEVLVEAQTYPRSVESQLARCEWSRERMNEEYVVARWNDISRDPRVGQRVSWEGTGWSYDGEPKDFQVKASARMNEGERGDPQWVRILRDDHNHGGGTIEAVSTDRREITSQLAQREHDKYSVSNDLSQESFKMERQQFTRGYSM